MSIQQCALCNGPAVFEENGNSVIRVVHPNIEPTYRHIGCHLAYDEPLISCVNCGSTEHFAEDADCQRVDRSAEPQPELQLLVIDLGDSCVVKVEKGSVSHIAFAGLQWQDNTTLFCNKPFSELRTAIEGDPPTPRIVKLESSSGYVLDVGPSESGACRDYERISRRGYEALSKLAGKALPVHDGGKWTKRLASDSKVGVDIGTGIAIWKFER